tara:strand:+ start:107 stop:538 length:432 start_codon:yes stop_codon:yes gene_type:complete
MSNVELFINALNNEDNKEIIDLNITIDIINNDKNSIISNLVIDNEKKQQILEKLKIYKLIDELPDLKYGSYIRWINIKNNYNVKLTNGGILCDIKIKNNGIILICKNNINKMFELNMSNNIIFQKLTNQELILLSAIEFVNSN